MLEGEAGRAFSPPRNEQRRDLDDLTLSPSRCTGVALGSGEFLECCRGVAAVGCYHGEEGVLDRVHRAMVGAGADERLIQC